MGQKIELKIKALIRGIKLTDLCPGDPLHTMKRTKLKAIFTN